MIYYEKRGSEKKINTQLKIDSPTKIDFLLVNPVSESRKWSPAEQNLELWHLSYVVAD